ncbi:MAG: hypothetical protein E7588_09220 [Ruminococcaceae bacterium]|nr:hypothetical protein [Oscillospiraceae bacterium]
MEKIKIKLLILPKFEVGEMSGDAPGEAQFYYDAYVKGGEEYEIVAAYENNKLYVKNGVALYVAGMGKVNAAISLTVLLTDARFDFSDAYVLSTGCCGAAYEKGVMGDVYLITACVDYDIGHRVDSTELSGDSFTTWMPDASYNSSSFKVLDKKLCEKVYELVKNIVPKTTPLTRKYMSDAFDGAEWAIREPAVLRATTLSGDNYWKGMRGHANGIAMTEAYGCPDPFISSEMEDSALAVVMDRMGMLDRFIAVRGAVNMDVFTNDMTPEKLWSVTTQHSLTSDDSEEAADIFNVAMENIFNVGRVIADAMLERSEKLKI